MSAPALPSALAGRVARRGFTDRELVVTAALVWVAALHPLRVPWWPAVAVVAVGVGGSMVQLTVVGLVLVASGGAWRAEAGLTRPLPARVAGVATVVADPVSDRSGTRVELALHGRRWLARVDRARVRDRSVVSGLLSGERVEVEGRPTRMRPSAWSRSRHLGGALQLDRVGAVLPAPRPLDLVVALRAAVYRGAEVLDPRQRALFLGIVTGDDRGQDPVQAQRFRRAGCSHLLAVSGQNVAFVLAVCTPLLAPLERRHRLPVVLALLGAFALVARLEPSVIRAVVMAGIAAVAVSRGRVATGWRVCGAAVVLLVCVDPLLVLSVGFQLSVAATVGLLALAAPLHHWATGRRGSGGWSTTMAAQLATGPLLVRLGYGVPIVGFAANLVAVPLAGVLMMWGTVAAPLAGILGAGPAAVLHLPTKVLLAVLERVVDAAASVPAGVLGPWQLGALWLALAMWWAAVEAAQSRQTILGTWSPRSWWWFGTTIMLGAVGYTVGTAHAPPLPTHPVAQLTPGATLVVTRGGQSALVVSRASPRLDQVFDGLQRHRVRHLDVLVIAGSDLDTPYLLRRWLPVEEIWVPRGVPVRGGRAPPEGDVSRGDLTLRVDRNDHRLCVSVAGGRDLSGGTCSFN